jgi:acyl-CoA thioesterase FadM
MIPFAGHTGTETFPVRTYDADSTGRAGIRAIADYFQEAASGHARTLGFPAERLRAEQLAWVLARLQITVNRFPPAGETVTAVTWPAAHERHMAYRCYELYTQDGELLAAGTSAWVTIHLADRSMVPLPDFIRDGYPQDNPPCRPFETRTLPRLREEAAGVRIRTRRADLDINGHVNNGHYLQWLLECMPCDRQNELRAMDISFRAECFADTEIVSARGALTGEHTVLHCIRTADDAKELCRARSRWAAPLG